VLLSLLSSKGPGGALRYVIGFWEELSSLYRRREELQHQEWDDRSNIGHVGGEESKGTTDQCESSASWIEAGCVLSLRKEEAE
jgi:hypothetical protein